MAMELSLNDLERIEVYSRWSSFYPPANVEKLIVTRQGSGFVREWSPAKKSEPLPSTAIAQLFTALSEPPIPELDPTQFAFSPWSVEIIRLHYGSVWTNDSPEHLIRLSFPNGRLISVYTHSQQAYMLPIRVHDSLGGVPFETFDLQLSLAMAGIMPDGYLEKDRLTGDGERWRHEAEHLTEIDEQFKNAPPADSVESRPRSIAEIEADLYRIFSRQESEAEKTAAEQSGRISERLLKAIPLEEVTDLLQRGANPNIADDVGQTALMHAAFPPLNRELFRRLVHAGANLEARRQDGLTGLQLACSGGETETAQEWIAAGANVNTTTPEGATPLMLAATWPRIVAALLTAGAEVNRVDQDGHSALVYAILKPEWFFLRSVDQLQAIQLLIEAGADRDRQDHEGITPLGHAQRVLDRVQLEKEVNQAFAIADGRNGTISDSTPSNSDRVSIAEAVVRFTLPEGLQAPGDGRLHFPR